MSVKVAIRRIVPKDREEELLPLLVQMRVLATNQPGYISGETLRNMEREEECIVISTWQSKGEWDKWFLNKQRIELQEKIDALLDKKTRYSVYYYG
ncbi:MAG: antibiotic biosynthesis monooxygenase [Deltaproteobacteria bacterium]|nr:antibiotic biosynthesis monooxygenase [Deltaproteobacteria bacterium]